MREALTDCYDTFCGEAEYINGSSTRDMAEKCRTALSAPSATMLTELRAEVGRWAASSKAWQDNHAEALEQIDTLRAELSAAQERVKELEADGKIVDHLADNCHLPNDHPAGGVFLVIGEDVIPHGGITLNTEKDRQTIRKAIADALSASAESAKPEPPVGCDGCGKEFPLEEVTHNETETLCPECQAAANEPNE